MLGFSFTVQILFPLPLLKVFIAHSTLVRMCLPPSRGKYGALPVSFHLVKAVEVLWGFGVGVEFKEFRLCAKWICDFSPETLRGLGIFSFYPC